MAENPGIDENVASALSYAGLWITGLIFFLIDKRPTVRFHAAQSMVVFGALQILYIILARVFFSSLAFGSALFSVGGLLLDAVYLVGLVLWIVLMIKAYQNEKFKVPIAGDIAQGIAGK